MGGDLAAKGCVGTTTHQVVNGFHSEPAAFAHTEINCFPYAPSDDGSVARGYGMLNFGEGFRMGI